MAVMLERWNDEKMDGLAAKVDRMDVRLEHVETELREQRKEMKAGFDKIEARFASLYLALIAAAGAVVAALIASPHL